VPQPLVSVVVATRDRPDRLERLLDSLAQQTLEFSGFEVVVVDDGSRADTARLLDSWEGTPRLRLRILRHQTPRGPSAARNAGWRAARGPLIAFTDDDCVAAADWLRAGLHAERGAPGSIVQGRTIPEPHQHRCVSEPFSHTVCVDALGPRYETCNIFYPRELLDRLGGFDESFGLRPAAEDTDLAWRAFEAGARAVFAAEAVVYHAVESLTTGQALRIATRWGEAIQVFARHPDVRMILHRGVFWNVWHYLMWRSIAALAAPAWLRRMVLTLHLIELRRRALRAGAGAGSVPFLLVHDLVECWAVARGAVRYRTLVL
jgi:GT2 family glycosyltransferase